MLTKPNLVGRLAICETDASALFYIPDDLIGKYHFCLVYLYFCLLDRVANRFANKTLNFTVHFRRMKFVLLKTKNSLLFFFFELDRVQMAIVY